MSVRRGRQLFQGAGIQTFEPMDLIWGSCDLYKRDGLYLNWKGTIILPGRFARATHEGFNQNGREMESNTKANDVGD